MAGTADKAGGMSGCRKSALIGLAILVGAIGFVWWRWFPSYTYHQKITVTVEAGGKEYSASSVTAVTWQYGPQLLAEIQRATATLQGEAVHLELPGGKHLFAVLEINRTSNIRPNGCPYDAEGLATYVFPEAVTRLYWPADMKPLRNAREIPVGLRPLLVTFDDILRPETVREVDPDFPAATIGDGVRLKSMTLAIVGESVGPGTIKATLPWLSDFPEPPLQSGKIIGMPKTFAQTLRHGAFIRREP